MIAQKKIPPSTLNYHDTTIFACEVNFLSNYILLRSTSTQKCLLGMSSPRYDKNQIFSATVELQRKEETSCCPIFRTYSIYLCPDSIQTVPFDCSINDKMVHRSYHLHPVSQKGNPGRAQMTF